jgi:hypothetical protein
MIIQVICKEELSNDRAKQMNPANIIGKEHEFKFNDGKPSL